MIQRFSLQILILLLCISSLQGQITGSKVKKENIQNAEKVFGLEFTDSERDSMLQAVNEQVQNLAGIRNYQLNNNVPPALIFNPIPVGMVFDQKQNQILFSNYSDVMIPVNKNDLSYYSIGQLAELIKTKKISSTELTRFFIDRLKKYDPQLKCVITLTEELALKQAEKADKEINSGLYKGMLHGIPFGVKDLLAVEGYKTTWGAMPYKDQMINETATVVKKLTDAGAVLVAKLSMGALAWGDVWFGGKTKNPWNTNEGSSGSSAGSASAVSAGLVPFAIGTETWGSIVSPSTICGVTGLRPTYGRVSRTGAMALSWTMDKIGPICRNCEDLAIVFDVIRGPDEKDQSLVDLPFNYQNKTDYSKIRIGYLKKDFDEKYSFHQNDSLVLAKIKELGAELIPIELPEFPLNDLSIILSAEAAAAFDELTRTNKDDLMVRQIKDAWPNVFRTSRFIPAVEYINANRMRQQLIQSMAGIMKNIDIYLAPSWTGNNLLLTNLTGHPCVVVPTGFNSEGSLTSITFIGRLFDEGRLISAAKKFQDATDYHLKHPKLN